MAKDLRKAMIDSMLEKWEKEGKRYGDNWIHEGRVYDRNGDRVPDKELDPMSREMAMGKMPPVFVPPTDKPCDAFQYCYTEYHKKFAKALTKPNSPAAAAAKKWLDECSAWAAGHKDESKPCK